MGISPSVLLFISVMIFIFIIASIPFPLRAAPGNKEEDLPGLPPLPPGETRIYGYAYALGGKVGSEFSQVSLNDGQSGLVQIRVDSNLYNLQKPDAHGRANNHCVLSGRQAKSDKDICL